MIHSTENLARSSSVESNSSCSHSLTRAASRVARLAVLRHVLAQPGFGIPESLALTFILISDVDFQKRCPFLADITLLLRDKHLYLLNIKGRPILANLNAPGNPVTRARFSC